jgi:hypothetical protein
VRAELLRRLEKLEFELADRAPHEGAIIWRCGEEVTEADRLGAAKAARDRGTPNAVLIFTRVQDMRVHRVVEAVHGCDPNPRIDQLLALRPEDRANAISEMHLLGRVSAAEAETLRRAIARAFAVIEER